MRSARSWVLLLAVVVLTACSTPNQGSPPRETGPEATNGGGEDGVFSDDFSDPSTGWFDGDATFDNSFENGTLQGEYTEEGTLRVEAEVAPGAHTVIGTVPSTSVAGGALQELGDVTVEVDVTLVERREVGTVGVVCRQDPQEGTFYTAYLLIDSGFPVDARIARSDAWDEDVEQLDGSDPLLDDADDATGTTFHLRLDCIGDAITFAVDGDVVAEATDATYEEGGVGFEFVSFMEVGVAEEGEEPRLVLEYDNFELRPGAAAD